MSDLQQRSAAWHAARRGKLTASNLGAALGLVRYTSRKTAFDRALGKDTFIGNEATDWGTRNEQNGIMEYQSLTGNVVQATGMHTHKDYTWLAGSPDGFVGERGMIEVKCPFYMKSGGRLHKQVPPHYMTQMNALMEICDRDWCDYICWSPEGMVVYRVYRNRGLFDFLLTFYGQFYAAMQAQKDGPPPLSTDTRAQITSATTQSVVSDVDYGFWSNFDPSDMPSADVCEAESMHTPPAKRAKCAS